VAPRGAGGEAQGGTDKAFDFAQETAKQVLTLATAVMTISLAFHRDLSPHPPTDARWALRAEIVLLFCSILAGVLVLMSLTGNLERPQDGKTPSSIYAKNITAVAAGQLLFFAGGLLPTAWFGVRAV